VRAALRISAIKNAHHGFDMDRPGKDSFRYREAGAGQVLIATGLRWALLTETPQRAASLDELLDELAPVRSRHHRRLQKRRALAAHRGAPARQRRAADLSA
jgi:molybdopterin-guanine dinucleotide biosynthesis protein